MNQIKRYRHRRIPKIILSVFFTLSSASINRSADGGITVPFAIPGISERLIPFIICSFPALRKFSHNNIHDLPQLVLA